MSLRHISFVLGDAPPPRLDKALARDVPEAEALSRTRLARLVEQGGVTVDGVIALDPKLRAEAGMRIVITVDEPQESHILPEAIALEIIHEDADLVVINKPAGMVVHPAPGSPTGTSAA
jgi:23S rRNA pseudouridine1911/1915/1917 synthase